MNVFEGRITCYLLTHFSLKINQEYDVVLAANARISPALVLRISLDVFISLFIIENN